MKNNNQNTNIDEQDIETTKTWRIEDFFPNSETEHKPRTISLKVPNTNYPPLTFKDLSLDAVNRARKQSEHRVFRGKNSVYEEDPLVTAQIVITESCIFPDLKSAELQSKYKVKTAVDLLKAMFPYFSEMEFLIREVFDKFIGRSQDTDEMLEEAKN